MIRFYVLCALLVGHMMVPNKANAQGLESSVIGSWKLKSFTRKDLKSGTVTNVFGDSPSGYLIYTKGGRVFAFLVGSDRKSPAKAEATDAERAELFRSMVGYTGTYKVVDGNKIAVRADTSWIQSWTGVRAGSGNRHRALSGVSA